MSAVLRSKKYTEAETRLANDPIVKKLASEIPDEVINELVNEDGEPTFEFILAARDQYVEWCKIIGQKPNTNHIGAVANAIMMIKKQTA